jgi:small subunit ribosomal protein S18
MPIRRKKDKENKDKTPTVARAKRTCYFCDNKLIPTYTDSQTLRKFMSDRSRIVASQRTGACSKHQRVITREIKYARHLSLLPFVASV